MWVRKLGTAALELKAEVADLLGKAEAADQAPPAYRR
jgi:hypothetical protein